jgi:hypothetical protein
MSGHLWIGPGKAVGDGRKVIQVIALSGQDVGLFIADFYRRLYPSGKP